MSGETQDKAGSRCRGEEYIVKWAILAATEYDLEIPLSTGGWSEGGYEQTLRSYKWARGRSSRTRSPRVQSSECLGLKIEGVDGTAMRRGLGGGRWGQSSSTGGPTADAARGRNVTRTEGMCVGCGGSGCW